MVSLLNPRLSPLNLDEEYNNALRSKSYIDIYSKLHHHQKNEDDQSHSAKDHEDEKLQYYEVEHTNQSLVDNLDQEEPACSRHFRNLLLDFFDTTRQSSDALSSLLYSLSVAKSHHRSIHRLLTKLISKSPNCSPQLSSTYYYYSQLSSQLDRENPLSTKNLATFHAAHGRYRELIQHLNSANRRIERRLRIRRLVFCLREWRRKLERVKRRVDGARRGAYIVGRDMDTVSQMVRRVEDEVEHEREVGRMVVRFMKKDDDKEEWGIVREVVKEIEGRGGRGREGEEEEEFGLEEQVEELEEHVYLCLITINRSRKMVALDTMDLHET